MTDHADAVAASVAALFDAVEQATSTPNPTRPVASPSNVAALAPILEVSLHRDGWHVDLVDGDQRVTVARPSFAVIADTVADDLRRYLTVVIPQTVNTLEAALNPQRSDR